LSSPEAPFPTDVARSRRALLAVTVANMLEWYDFAVYAFLAQVIAGVMFPVRSSGMGVAYNCAVTVFGGFAPLIATGLVARTGNPLSPTWYVIFSCGLSLIALLLTLRTSYRRAIPSGAKTAEWKLPSLAVAMTY
jgi:hypothetical protein